MYYIHKDYLGSFETITDNNGQVLEKLTFDPCLSAVTLVKAEGRRRNPTNWSFNNVPETFLFDRGFTGHEHLDNFDLVNMPARRSNSGGGNGRVYDPWLGRMLSPDPFLQAPGNSQSYNRYSYAYNNPLKYTDPSGYTERLSIVPGSGNHWSDPFRGEYGNYMIMSSSTFNNYYGAGSTDIVDQIWSNPDALKKWKKGELTLEQIRDDGGFEVDYSITYESDWPFNNGNKTLPVIERISKWVSVGSAGGGVPHGGVMFYDEGGNLLYASGQGSENIIHTVSSGDISKFQNSLSALNPKSSPLTLSDAQLLADVYGKNSYSVYVGNGVNGTYVLGNINAPLYMHTAAALSIMGEGAALGSRGIPISNQHTVVNYWKQYYTPTIFQKWW